jgi:hypothetical protein
MMIAWSPETILAGLTIKRAIVSVFELHHTCEAENSHEGSLTVSFDMAERCAESHMIIGRCGPATVGARGCYAANAPLCTALVLANHRMPCA